MNLPEIQARLKEHMVSELGLDPDIAADEPLFTSNTLDSLDILKLVLFVEQGFGVTFKPIDVSIESFDTIDRIAALVHERAA